MDSQAHIEPEEELSALTRAAVCSEDTECGRGKAGGGSRDDFLNGKGSDGGKGDAGKGGGDLEEMHVV